MAEPDGGNPALASFAQQLDALREQRRPARVGVMVPTCERPELARFAVLQFAAQSRPPDIICVHQHGVEESYRWSVADLEIAPRIVWLHTSAELPRHQWYSIPLRRLLEEGCSHIFWAEHDKLYLRGFIDKGLQDMKQFDFARMGFTRRFASALLADIEADTSDSDTDKVLAQVTKPKFSCKD